MFTLTGPNDQGNRRCLYCDKIFLSPGAHVRLCPYCKNILAVRRGVRMHSELKSINLMEDTNDEEYN